MGCNRVFTPAEHEQSLRSRTDTTALPRKRRDTIREAMHRAPAALMRNVLSDPKNRCHQSAKLLLSKSIGCTLEVVESEHVAEALADILKDHPNAMGLFERAPAHYGPGATPVSQHYEITSTAALTQKSFKSLSGQVLRINPADRVDFGIKFASGYAQARRGGTIEADTLVTRDYNYEGFKVLAIDSKFSKTGKYSKKPELERQLKGVATGFKDGKIDEFFFVTNGFFEKDFKEAVEKQNISIAKDVFNEKRIFYADVPKDLLSLEEREHAPKEDIPKDFFNPENIAAVKKIVSLYHIPQIELCEFVTYRK